MNAYETSNSDRNLFNRATLELTFRVLRKRRPALALEIQNTLATTYPRNDYHAAFTASELPLAPAIIHEITQALLDLSEELLANNGQQRNDLVIVRSLLLDWLMLSHECQQPAA